jgi:DNA-binding beta-propeller fold protein YncE
MPITKYNALLHHQDYLSGIKLITIDPVTNLEISSIPLNGVGSAAASNGKIYLANFDNTIQVFDKTTNTIINTLTGFNAPVIEASANGKIYISNN